LYQNAWADPGFFNSFISGENGISDMSKRKPGQTKIRNAPANKEQAIPHFEKQKRLLHKYRTWAFIIWVIGFMLIMAKWGKFF